VPEEVFWIAGRTAFEQEPYVDAHRAMASPPRTRAFTDTGYVAMRDGAGGHLIFDVGPHGYMNGGHAHADALSVTLSVAGGALLVDPGTSTYTVNPPLRDRLRRSENHNTLTLDGRSPSIPAGPFHWETRADARLGALRQNPAFDWVEGTHDGYIGNRHRRTVLRTPSGEWLIVDEVLGRGRHTADLHWHFDPSWTVIADNSSRLRAMHLDGRSAWIAHDDATVSLLVRAGLRDAAANVDRAGISRSGGSVCDDHVDRVSGGRSIADPPPHRL
jgi:hypothetical protein